MSELSDLLQDMTKDLPPAIRKVIDTAVENGWELNKPGLTVALRLNHPTDELAQPVYAMWVVSRTPKGALSYRFDSCGTKGQVPLKGPELLDYLKDPTTVYMTDEDIAVRAREIELKTKPWSDRKTEIENVKEQLGGQVVAIEIDRTKRSGSGESAREIMERARKARAEASAPAEQASPVAPSRRVTIKAP